MSPTADYLLLASFRALFEGRQYIHRNPNLGDQVAQFFYEDLARLGRSPKLVERVRDKTRVLNRENQTVGRKRRRGDASFGELVPAAVAIDAHGFSVARGPIATIEIGAEIKILAKAMIKQIDRVVGDLSRQVDEFRRGGDQPICIAFVGVNFAQVYTSYEGERSYPTLGRGGHSHPVQEAQSAIAHLNAKVRAKYDEFQLLEFRAGNTTPFSFEWVNEQKTVMEYSAVLTRVSAEYEKRF